MRYIIILVVAISWVIPSSLWADTFLGAPVIPEGKIILQTDSRLELEVDKSHDQVLQYYKKALKDFKDIRYRDWKDATYIEDDGKMPWHSITISKSKAGEKVSVVIIKDNWTWIIGTLILRFIGVFVVLLVLFVAMSISGAIIHRTVKKLGSKKGQEEK